MPARTDMIGKTVSHYEITEQLGRGGMGIVYKAVDTKLKRPVALKFLPVHLSADADAKNRFIQEAQAASALDHANICTIYEIGETPGPDGEAEVYIAMAYYQGQTLKYRLESEDFAPERAADIARQLAAALGRAHESGIVHRDVKPANIMLTDRGEVKLLDFGLAKLLGGAELTQAGSTLGTAGYMSPEQVKGDEVTPASDLWSLGVVLYEMLAGRKPFTGDYEQAAMYAILNETPEDLAGIRPGLPHAITDLATRCLEKDPAQRPQSAAEIIDGIEESGLVSGSGSRTAVRPPAAAGSRPGWLLPAAGVAAAAVIALAAILLWPRTEAVSPAEVVAPDPAIAVLPFSVGGDESLDYLRNGMVRLLSTRFDGMGDIRSIDPNALLVQSEVKTADEIDPSTGIEMAERFNAENFVIGSVLKIGGPIQVSANLYDRTGTSVQYSEVTIAADSLLLPAVDQVARELLSGKFEGPAQAMTNLAVVSTSSFEALRDYLRGEELMHEGQFNEAKPFFRSAVDRDSTFALGWLRLSEAFGWSDWGDPTYAEGLRKAVELSSRLPALDRERLEIHQMLRQGEFLPAIQRAENQHRRHPDDLRTLLLLGDYQWHYNAYYGKPAGDAEQYFREVLGIDGGLAEAKFHLMEIFLRDGRFAEADSLASTMTSGFFAPQAEAARLAASLEDTSTTDADIGRTLSDHDEAYAEQTLFWLASGARRPDDARRVERILDGETEERGRGLIARLSGQYERNLRALREAEEPARFRLSYLLTYYPLTDTDIDRIAAYVEEPEDTTGVSRFPDFGIVLANFPATEEMDRGLVDWRRGDFEALRSRRDALASTAGSDRRNNLAFSVSRLFDALLLWHEGRIDEADAAFEESIVPIGIRLTPRPYFNLAANRFLRGRMLFEAGRYAEAMRWLASVEDGFLALGPASELYFPALYLTAQSHEQLGEYEQAADLYARFVRAWEEADPALQAMVKNARTRLEALAVRAAREPGS